MNMYYSVLSLLTMKYVPSILISKFLAKDPQLPNPSTEFTSLPGPLLHRFLFIF
ncbi:hypothetical protein BofuT4_uP141510.1 [Botrytis cinerea T4]|uniref:Uncharacterized protein n=1 Tax=Botryotinia fuckeliana (strain T4) TaxID=999810 RepID=G2YZ41_BOTF4|nr:hypothetical protein BofuT4_uP141510.1 [Botrytis cinerea T4]